MAKKLVSSSDRQKGLEAALGQIERAYGKNTVQKLGANASMIVETFSTGSFAIDNALGVGGLPRGRIIEIYGPESSGKTTLALHAIASAQKQGGTAAFIDAEHALDPTYARSLGVDTNELLINQPDNGEQALEIVSLLVQSGGIDLIVVDSVAALVPKAELDGDMGASHVGLQARLMSQALRKLTGAVSETGCTIIFINQLREKIGVMFGSPETTTGGKALKFYASVRIDIRRIGALKEGTEMIGNETKVKIVKNKLAPPFKEARTNIYYGKGFSHEGEIIEFATTTTPAIIKKSGSWFSYEGDQLGQGLEKTRQFLIDNPELFREITVKVFASLGLDENGKRVIKDHAVEDVADEVIDESA